MPQIPFTLCMMVALVLGGSVAIAFNLSVGEASCRFSHLGAPAHFELLRGCQAPRP